MKNFVVLLMKEKCPKMNGKMGDFFAALYIVYEKLTQFFFHTLLANLFDQRYIRSVTCYKVKL